MARTPQPRLVIDQSHATGLEIGEQAQKVLDLEGDVMEARTTGGDGSSNDTVAGRFEGLQPAVPRRNHPFDKTRCGLLAVDGQAEEINELAQSP